MRCNPWRWLWGIIPVGILAYLTVQWEHERIEADLKQRTETALTAANLKWAATAFDGRDGLVTGQATTDDASARAAKVVRDVWGVRVTDARTHLLPQVTPYQWSAAQRGNRVKLNGYVPNDELRSTILGVVKATFPKAEIDDKLELARGAPEQNEWLGGIGFALRQLAGLKSGTVNFRDNGLSIEGEALGFGEYKSVKGALRNNLPAGIKLVADNVQPPVASPYVWSAKRSGNQLVISGHVPDEGTREQIFALAKQSFPRLAVVDRLETAQGAPQGFTAIARAALEQLVALTSGEVKLSDKTVSLTGEAPDQPTAGNVATAFRAAAKGFEVTDTITYPQPKPPLAAPYVVRAEAGPREVVLSGNVPSEEARAELLASAAKRFPNRQITDRLQLASGEPANWRQCLDAALGGLAKLDSGTAVMTDATLDLDGRTGDEPLAGKLPGEIRAAANRACETNARIAFDAPPEPQLTWRAAHDGAGNVVLEGQVPSAETRDALAQSAGRLFPGAKITDRMTVAGGASQKWQSTSLLGLKLLSSLRKGEAVISKSELTVGGEAKDAAVQTTARDQLAHALAAPYKGREAIEVRSDAMIWSEKEARRKAEEQAARERAEAEARRKAEIDSKADEERLAREAADKDAVRKEAEARAVAEKAAPANVVRKQEADLCQVKLREIASTGTINFTRASADLERDSLPTLARLAEVAKACPAAKIEIEGHTDAEGLPERNQSLSQRRAQAVVNYLAGVGIAADRLSAVGYGAERPVAPNDTAANRAKNRRIEFTVRAE